MSSTKLLVALIVFTIVVGSIIGTATVMNVRDIVKDQPSVADIFRQAERGEI